VRQETDLKRQGVGGAQAETDDRRNDTPKKAVRRTAMPHHAVKRLRQHRQQTPDGGLRMVKVRQQRSKNYSCEMEIEGGGRTAGDRREPHPRREPHYHMATRLAASAPARAEVRLAGGESRLVAERQMVLIRRFLLFDVLLDDRQGSAAARDNAIRPGPEHRLAVDAPEAFGKFLAQQARCCGFKVVDEAGQIEVRRQGDEQMDMIGLAVHF